MIQLSLVQFIALAALAGVVCWVAQGITNALYWRLRFLRWLIGDVFTYLFRRASR